MYRTLELLERRVSKQNINEELYRLWVWTFDGTFEEEQRTFLRYLSVFFYLLLNCFVNANGAVLLFCGDKAIATIFSKWWLSIMNLL